MQVSKQELKIISESFVISSAFMVFIYFLNLNLPENSVQGIKRILTMLGADFFNGGYIQWVTYFASVWTLKEVTKLRKRITAESSYFKADLLPTSEKHLLIADDVYHLQQKIKDFEKKQAKTLLTNIIKNACAKFRSTKNISEVLDIINILTEMHRDNSEIEQTNIRFLLWSIPSLGFIGTVLGISQALAIANSNDMNKITSTLGVAFDTTLISLVLSVLLMWLYHDLQKQTEKFHVKSKEYVIENLVNRIEV